MNDPDNGRVSYSVKELLQSLDKKLDAVSEKLNGKVDVLTFQILEQRVAVVEQKLSSGDVAKHTAEVVAKTLVEKNNADSTFWERRRSLIAWCLGGLVGLSQLHQSFPSIHP